jgi:hypothetical protein
LRVLHVGFLCFLSLRATYLEFSGDIVKSQRTLCETTPVEQVTAVISESRTLGSTGTAVE